MYSEAMNILIRMWICIILGLNSAALLSNETQQHRVSAATGAETWEIQASGVALSLTQILPEQVRAFYVNRGFTLQQIESYATACIYMTVLRNEKAPGVIHFVLNDWRVVTTDSIPRKIPVVGEWMIRLKEVGGRDSAMVAFRWAQFPPEQTYEPGGDWNQGMLAMGLGAGAEFDLTARWDSEGKPYQVDLKGVRCAK